MATISCTHELRYAVLLTILRDAAPRTAPQDEVREENSQSTRTPERMTMITLYQQQDSGNCYKVRLVLSHLDRPFRTVAVSSFDGSTRRPEFLAMNPIGKVPTVQLGDGRFLAEPNAILLYFGEGTALLPDDTYDRAKACEWLFFEQYSHEPAIAVRRALSVYPERRAEATAERMAQLLESGNRALAVMEHRLGDADWLAGSSFSLADISLYAYTHMAGDAGYELQRFPGIRRWLTRIAAMPRHVAIGDAAPAER
jgi:glutathione S-transferase